MVTVPRKDDTDSVIYIFKKYFGQYNKGWLDTDMGFFPVRALNHSFALEDAYADNFSFVH